MNRNHRLSALASLLALACGGTVPVAATGPSPSPSSPAPPGTPPPAIGDPSPPPAGGSGSNRFQIGAGLGLYLVDPAHGEPAVQGLVNVTYGPTGAGAWTSPPRRVGRGAPACARPAGLGVADEHPARPARPQGLPVLPTTAPAYLLDLRWPGPWVIDGQTGGFCGLAKRWTYAK
jgi:hypothetical protein